MDRHQRMVERRIRAARFPRRQEPGHLRLPGHPIPEQGHGHGTGAVRIHPEAGQRNRHRQPVQECPSCPWVGLLQAHFKCRIIAVIRHLRRPRSCCPNPFPSPVMLQTRPAPGATRSARPPGPGTPSGPTSVTGPAFTAGPGSRGSTCPGTWRPSSATTWSAWRRTADGWPPSGRPGRPSSRAPSWRGGPSSATPASRRCCGGWAGSSGGPRDRRRPSTPRPLAAIRATAFTRPPHPGRSYRDGGIRPAPRLGRRRLLCFAFHTFLPH